MIIQKRHKRFLKKVIDQLSIQTNFNYRTYKEATVFRRIEKRIKALKLYSFEEYFNYFKTHPKEVELLAKDIFINVSYFFRDKVVFNAIEKQIVPEILKTNIQHPLKVWIAGCATGEEAYSISILLHRVLQNKKFNFKIIASDIDEDALSIARAGIYHKQELQKIKPTIVNSYFDQTELSHQLKIKKFVRDDIIFTKHDLIADPPFGKVDLLLCRNVLIYLNANAQQNILNKFRFSLNTNGYLILGKSESPTFIYKNFTAFSKVLKIFKKLSGNDLGLPFESIGYGLAEKTLPLYHKTDHGMNKAFNTEFKDYIYKNYQPALIIISERLQIQHITNEAVKYIQNPEDLTGRSNINTIFNDDLVAIIKSAIILVNEKKDDYIYNGYAFSKQIVIDIVCRQINITNVSKAYYSIEFRLPKTKRKGSVIQSNKINTILKNQLEKTEQELQQTIQQLEKTNQNLESFNEELQSTNEEYLSVNEELQSINLEYQSTIDELSQANIYIDSLMHSTQIGTLFLDKALTIKKFTESIQQLINITELDIGRPIHHFTHQFLNDEWQSLLKKFFKTGKPIEHEIQDRSNNWYLLKIQSYKLQNERQKGASVNFIDINSLKKTEQELKESELLFRSIFDATNDGIILYNIKELRPIKVNRHILTLYNITEEEFFKTPILKFFPEVKLWNKSAVEKRKLLTKIITNYNNENQKCLQKRKDGLTFWVNISCIAMPSPFNDYCINVIKDVTEQEQKNLQLKESELLFRTVFEYANDGFVLINHLKDKIEKVNQKQLSFYGYKLDEYLKLKPIDRMPTFQLDGSLSVQRRKRILKESLDKKTYKKNWVLQRKDSSTFIAEVNAVKLPEPFAHLELNVVRDITESIENQKELQLNRQKYEAYFQNSIVGIIQCGLNGEFLDVNDAFVKMTGYSRKELATMRPKTFTHPDDIVFSQQKLHLLQINKIKYYTVDKRYINKKNEIVFVRAFVTGIYNKDNILTGYYATILNRTYQEKIKKSAESRLNVHEANFNNNLVSRMILCSKHKIIHHNLQLCKFLGSSSKQLNGTRLKQIVHPTDFSKLLKRLQAVKFGGTIQFSEKLKFLHNENYAVYANVFVFCTFNENNKLEFINTTILDISNEESANRRLIESENKYKTLFNNTFLATIYADTKGHFLEVNRAFNKLFGYTKADLTVLKISDLLHPNGEFIDKEKLDLMHQQKIKSIELKRKLIKKNKQVIIANVFINALYSSLKELIGFNIMLFDITEKTNIKEKLELSTIKSAIVLNNSLVAELSYNNEYKLTSVNKKACQFFGYSSKHLLKLRYKDVFAPDEDKEILKQINLLRSNKIEHFYIQQKFIKKNSTHIYGKVFVTSVKNKAGEIVSYYVLIVDVTAEVTATNSLIESQSKFKGIFDSALHGIILYDTQQQKVIDCNKGTLEYAGCKTVKEFVRTPIYKFVDINDFSKNKAKKILEDLRNKKTFSATLKLKQKNKKNTYSIKLFTYRLSKPYQHIAIINLLDVDKEIKAKVAIDLKNKELLAIRDELKLSRNKYKLLFNNNLVGIAILNEKNQIVENNTAFNRLFGYVKGELTKVNISKLVLASEKKDCTNVLKNLQSGLYKKHLFQRTYLKKDKKLIQTNNYVKGFYRKEKYTGAVISIVDISKIVATTEKLKEKENHLQAIINSSFTFSVHLSLDGKLISENESSRARNRSINPKINSINKYIWDSFWMDGLKESQKIVKDDFHEVIRTGKDIVNQIKCKVSKDSYGYLKYCIKLAKDSEGKPILVLMEGMDVTELVESKTMLSNTVDELKRYIDYNLELEKFAYIASHDLKEPIRSITSFSQLLERELIPHQNKNVEEYLGYIQSAAQSMTILIEDILMLSQVHNRRFKVSTVNVNKLIDEVLTNLQFLINQKEAIIQIEKLPKTISANKIHMVQIFQNLISNALKFHKPDTQPVINISAIQRKKEVEFIVSDNGIGIEEQYHDQIFLTFKKLHNKDDFEGTGIGLSICKRIVEIYAGKIWVNSTLNGGASFHFILKEI